MRHAQLAAIVVIAVLMSAIGAARFQNPPAPMPATPDNLASFLGEWTIKADGSYGPVTMGVTLKAADGKVVGELTDQNGKHALVVSKAGTSAVLSYVFDYQGMAINAAVTLTPNEKGVEAYLDFASGAATFTGTATKK